MRAALLACALVAALLAVGAGVVASAQDPGALRERAEQARARERTLAASVARLAAHDRRLARQIAALERRRAAVQADLERDAAKLAQVQADLRRERARAVRLRARLAQARRTLARRLVERYTAPHVDALSVVLNSASFGDLLERADFLRRIQQNDEEILVAVRIARADAIRERRRLDAAEERQRRVVAGLRARRNAIAAMAAGAAARRVALQRVRAARAQALRVTRRNRRKVERDLRAAEAAVARAAAAPAASRGPWAIPWAIVQCESGGQNLPPNSAGASGYYQILPETWRNHGGSGPAAHLASKAEQDRVAARIWSGRQGPGAWVCTDLVR